MVNNCYYIPFLLTEAATLKAEVMERGFTKPIKVKLNACCKAELIVNTDNDETMDTKFHKPHSVHKAFLSDLLILETG